uniref:Uncharacterized protein n=1 Tax=Aegilops tauschii subsp. strangulata TaxID=200361 RepID=A0A452YX89_AEGTS
WCRPLAITFTIILLVWHLIAVVTIEAAEHCAFSLLTVSEPPHSSARFDLKRREQSNKLLTDRSDGKETNS